MVFLGIAVSKVFVTKNMPATGGIIKAPAVQTQECWDALEETEVIMLCQGLRIQPTNTGALCWRADF
jgi:hypothetical protein